MHTSKTYALIKKSKKNLTEAQSELKKALEILDPVLLYQQQTMSILFGLNSSKKKTLSNIEEQINNRINLLYLCKTQIEHGIASIDDAEKGKAALLGVIGLVQTAAGAALIVFSSDTPITLGTALLSEGIGDIFYVIRLCTCGVGCLKETGTIAKSAFQGDVRLFKTARIGGQQLMGQFTRESYKLVGKKIGYAFVERGVKEVLGFALDTLVLD